jgi:hypothetical protein
VLIAAAALVGALDGTALVAAGAVGEAELHAARTGASALTPVATPAYRRKVLRDARRIESADIVKHLRIGELPRLRQPS